MVPLRSGLPVRSEFVSVHRVVGFSSRPESLPLSIDLAIAGVTAKLVADPNPDLAPIDRALAMLGAVFGSRITQPYRRRMFDLVDRRSQAFAQKRIKDHGIPGVFLVIRVTGDARTRVGGMSRDVGKAVIAFDAVDKQDIKGMHERLTNVLLTATALGVGQNSPELVKVAEGVALTLVDGRPLYSVTITPGSAKISTARVPNSDDALRIAHLASALLNSEELITPARLLADALRCGDERLEAFLFSWAAREMIVKKHTRDCESGKWLTTVPSALQLAATEVHTDFLAAKHKGYSLTGRVKVLCLMLGLDDWEQVAKQVSVWRKAHREPLYHEGHLKEAELPVEETLNLVRRLLALILDKTR